MSFTGNGKEREQVILKQAKEMKRIFIWMAQYDGHPNNLKTQAQCTLDELKH